MYNMGDKFQGGVCGGTWWNPPRSLFSGSLSSPCSVAQLCDGGFDKNNFGWHNQVVKGKLNSNPVFDNFIVPHQIDSSPTFDWNHLQNLSGNNEGNIDSNLQDNLNSNSKLSSYLNKEKSSNSMLPTNFCNTTNNASNVDNQKGASPPMALTTSGHSSGGSGGGSATSFPVNSSTPYLIQSLFDDSNEPQVLELQSFPSNNESLDASSEIILSNYWVKSSSQPSIPSLLQLIQSNKLEGEINALINGCNGQVINGQYSPTTISNVRASLLNSLKSRSRGLTSSNQKSHSCASKVNNSCSNDKPSPKRQRIETPSNLPTFKVRKEKLGDRITVLQQLVSPFGKTDTASVLNEAVEYIKFLHHQVNILRTPNLKSGTAMQQQECEKLMENEEGKEDLRSRGLCLVPISSTYPLTQETPADFWTPTFE